MATVSIGTLQSTWNLKATTTESGGVVSRGTYAHATALWSEDIANGIYVISTLAEANSLALMFYGKESASGGVRTASARIWLVSEITNGTSTNVVAMCIGDIQIILGTTQANGGIFATTGNPFLFASDIKITDDRSLQPPAMRVMSVDGTLGIGMMLADSIGAKSVIVSMSRDTGNVAEIGLCSRPL